MSAQDTVEGFDLPARRKAERVRARFWPKMARYASRIPFASDLLAAYYCAFDRNTPSAVRLTLLGALAYFILPTDAVADFLPVIGFTDDAGVLAAAIAMVARHITDDHRRSAEQAIERLRTEEM